MTVSTSIMIHCDGGALCPLDGNEACVGDRAPGLNTTLRAYRAYLRKRGWIVWKRLDFCEDCVSRLGLRVAK